MKCLFVLKEILLWYIYMYSWSCCSVVSLNRWSFCNYV